MADSLESEAGSYPVTKGSLGYNGARLAYEVAGRGPAIVLIHAGIADMRMWDEPFQELAKRFRVLRYDTRGFGQSVTEPVSFSNRADLLALMDHVHMDRAVVVGNSIGGQIAIDFALEHPSRVNGLVLVAAGVSGLERTPEGAALKPTDREQAAFNQIDALYAKKDLEAAARLEADTWASGPEQRPDRAPAAVRERLRRMILHNNRTHTAQARPVVLSPPAAGRLGELKIPVLVLVGDMDERATRAMADYVAHHAPHARKVEYRDTGHMVSLERPEEFVREVTEFTRQASKENQHH